MRPLRLLLSLTSCIFAITLLLYVSLPATTAQPKTATGKKQGKLSAFFSFHTPSSLFPPSAIISLTDDNSTFFLARPAAFGPYLPSKGLSGQLWIGSGFGDDHLGHGSGLTAGAEGELGCSDVPGWEDGTGKAAGKVDFDGTARRKTVVAAGPNAGAVASKVSSRFKRDDDAAGAKDSEEDEASPPTLEDDGTDAGASDSISPPPPASQPEHADIQSLQESAEIAGKVVLLSRGGCSFLDKVKWVQRRGGVALIVGDDVRGGPLKTMYARGDTSNITIPALFTSHTTAHLLSSLIPSGGIIDNIPGVQVGTPALAAKGKGGKSPDAPNAAAKKKPQGSLPTFTKTSAVPKATSVKTSKSHKDMEKTDVAAVKRKSKPGFFGSIFSLFGLGGDGPNRPGWDSSRPPSSGHIDWVLLEDWNDDRPPKPTAKPNQAGSGSKKSKTTTSKPGDGFQIGVQDWRDPDLVETPTTKETGGSREDKAKDVSSRDGKAQNKPKGGSITPGSGVYEKPSNDPVDLKHKAGHSKSAAHHEDSSHFDEESSWLSHLSWSAEPAKDHGSPPPEPQNHKDTATSHELSASKAHAKAGGNGQHEPEFHEGLWVTLTPTSMSSSPFFDTLLVLVVSPLITLTVVYALLLLRSRIRRRRWRAPKSVVERLPVRTYHTISNDTTTSATPVATTPVAATPTTPLIAPTSQSRINDARTRPRPRSRTTSEVPAQASSMRSGRAESSSSEPEKRDAGLSEWRRRYGGRQKECVVCLEEYVDGVSRVMSLPCGHEFHAECITPWLTTRRRTCPICKGDVVRSLASNASSSAPNQYHYVPFHDDSEDEVDVQAQAAENRNDSPAAAVPIPVEELDAGLRDLERGHEDDHDEPLAGPTRVVEAADVHARALWRRVGDIAGWTGGRRGDGSAEPEMDRNR